MIAAIMQPYFFPYIGYFQLMSAVDTFVFFDDVQYIERGWVNRNRIRGNDAPVWLTMPVQKASRELAICQRQYAFSNGDAVRRTQQRLAASYAKSACYFEAAPLIAGLLKFDDTNVAAFNANLLAGLARQMDINCRFLTSSQIDKPYGLKGQAKVIDLCRRIGASHYINPIGGVVLYDDASFNAAGLKLSFLRTTTMPVSLCGAPHHLSIIDRLMREGITSCHAQLTQYELEPAK